MAKQRKKDIVILSNKHFKEIWNEANRCSSLTELEHNLLSVRSDKYIDYDKLGFTYNSMRNFLKQVFTYSHYSFRDLLQITGYTVTGFSDAFCIPIQTVKTWAGPKSTCASYTMLTYLRYFEILNFEDVKIEEDVYRYGNAAKSYSAKIRDVAKLLSYFDETDKFDFFKPTKTGKTEPPKKAIAEPEPFVSTENFRNPEIKYGPLHGKSLDESILALTKK